VATESDAGAIAALANARSEQLYGEADASADEVRRWFAYAGLEMRVAEIDGRVVGYLDMEREEGWRVPMDVRVHPDARESGVVDALIRTAEGWAREHAGEGEVLRAIAFEREDFLRRALEEAGYRFIRFHFFMGITLGGELPMPEWPLGIDVRGFRAEDEQAVYEAVMEAFRDHWDFRPEPYSHWRQRSVERDDFDPSLWLIAWDGDELAGFSLNNWEISGDPTRGWVGSLGVRRTWRRRGLATALLQASFSAFAGRGATHVALAVDAENLTGAVRLYERVGMRVERRFDGYEKAVGTTPG
jgi:mycothiol synthase